MKTISLTIDLSFDEDIADDDMIKEVAGNVLKALAIHANEIGLAPTGTEAVTTKIEVFEPYTNNKLTYSLWKQNL
jgi:hypothetical protein